MEASPVLLLRHGPRTARDLMLESGMPRKSFYRLMDRLEREGRVMRLPKDESGRWVSLYSLPEDALSAVRECGYTPVGQNGRSPPQRSPEGMAMRGGGGFAAIDWPGLCPGKVFPPGYPLLA